MLYTCLLAYGEPERCSLSMDEEGGWRYNWFAKETKELTNLAFSVQAETKDGRQNNDTQGISNEAVPWNGGGI